MSFLELLTAGGAKWYETLPFLVGILFVVIELLVRYRRKVRPYFTPTDIGIILSEGVSFVLTPLYGLSLIFNPTFASELAAKNGKILAIAMLVAFGSLVLHLSDRWFGDHRS